MLRRSLWVLAGVVGAFALFGAARVLQPGPRVEADLVFCNPGGVPLKLDLARPAEGAGPFPAVICLHGGGWIGGDRKQMSRTIEVLARRGYVAVAPDYRLAPQHHFPAALEDCKAAVRWLRGNAARYRVDAKHVGVVGLAAGGHLACLLGVTQPADGLEGTGGPMDQPSGVQAVVSFFGPTDLTAGVWSQDAIDRNLVPLLGGTPSQKPELCRKASPLHYPCNDVPPFLFLHGSSDSTVPLQQSTDLAAHIRQMGGSAEVFTLTGERHGFHDRALLLSIDHMLTFLDKTLKP
jgi:acetyl esterase/lipase